MNINVHIERITLEGVEWQPAQRAQFERAFAGELSRLLQAVTQNLTGLNASHTIFTSQNLPGLAGDAALPANATPRNMGVQVAQSVFNAMQDA
jgi:hypothetical protein